MIIMLLGIIMFILFAPLAIIGAVRGWDTSPAFLIAMNLGMIVMWVGYLTRI